MSWKEFIKTNWRNAILTTLLLILIPNLIEFLGNSNEVEYARENFNFLSIEFGGSSFLVMFLSSFSLIVISITFTFYFLKKNLNYKDIFKIILLSAILFSIIGFAKFLITVRTPDGGGAVEYFSPIFMMLSNDFARGISDILNILFSRFLIYKSIFYILLPSVIIIGFFKFRKH